MNTQSIKYTGSKLKLLPFILQKIAPLPVKRILDGFSGSTRVAQALAQHGYQVVSNDISVWSEVLAKCYLQNTYSAAHYQPMIAHLNALPRVSGWFTEYYGGEPGHFVKRPFQRKNSEKLDAIRLEIEQMRVSEIEKAVLLTALLLALDEVDNTLGHYVAYLSKWSSRSYKNLELKVPQLHHYKEKHEVWRKDIFDAITTSEFDLAYLDPPYGSNNLKMPASRVRYAAYYHLWTTIINNDQPELFGKANRRLDSKDPISSSIFEEFRKGNDGRYLACHAMERLISNVKAEYILLSYSSGGRISKSDLLEILTPQGTLLSVDEINHKKNVMAQMSSTQVWCSTESANVEYLFLLKKSN